MIILDYVSIVPSYCREIINSAFSEDLKAIGDDVPDKDYSLDGEVKIETIN